MITIREIARVTCVQNGCGREGNWVVIDSNRIVPVGYFCKTHALAQQRELEPCVWFKGCTLHGHVSVLDVDGSWLGPFCVRHAGSQERRVAKRKTWSGGFQ
jgi:hypothetical protein